MAPAAYNSAVLNQELPFSAAFTVASMARLSASATLDDFQHPCRRLEVEQAKKKGGKKENSQSQLIPLGKFGSLQLSFKVLVQSAKLFAVGLIQDLFIFFFHFLYNICNRKCFVPEAAAGGALN